MYIYLKSNQNSAGHGVYPEIDYLNIKKALDVETFFLSKLMFNPSYSISFIHL
jgi:hypothetical protein